MKKTISLIFPFLILLSCLSNVPTGAAGQQLRIEVDLSSPLILKFPKANIRVEGWNQNYISIKPFHSLKKKYKIETTGNLVALNCVSAQAGQEEIHARKNNSSGLFGDIHFLIKIPKESPLAVEAEELQLRDDCQVALAKSKKAVFRNCAILDDFIGEGDSIRIRHAQIGRNCHLIYQRINIANSQVQQLILSERPDSQQIYATVKRVKGEEMEIRADRPDKLTVFIHTSNLKRLTVNSAGGSGDVILWWTAIGELTEKSSLRIHPFIVW